MKRYNRVLPVAGLIAQVDRRRNESAEGEASPSKKRSSMNGGNNESERTVATVAIKREQCDLSAT